MKKILVVGAGLAGAVVARQLADHSDFKVLVTERRNHVAGNCHTGRDAETGVMVHTYGAHIFHTSNIRVWNYIRSFGEFMPFINRPKAYADSGIYSLPINLHTINQFFGTRLSPAQAAEFIASKVRSDIQEPKNFEEQALKFMGEELYQEFFYAYTKKHWGCEPVDLPASILKRLPLRYSYNDSYYNSIYQGIPVDGYTKIVERILDHDQIAVQLNQAWEPDMAANFDHVFFSGPLDQFYQYRFGELSYRTLRWEVERAKGDLQGHAALNYTSGAVPFTRRREHKHYEYWKKFDNTIVFTEFAAEARIQAGDELYYPKRLIADKSKLSDYISLAKSEKHTTFMGRLGTYRYLDMHQVIEESLALSEDWLKASATGADYPTGYF
ncbi:MAG: UDP-galactopyranose mutase [Pseudomonadota bacterium]